MGGYFFSSDYQEGWISNHIFWYDLVIPQGIGKGSVSIILMIGYGIFKDSYKVLISGLDKTITLGVVFPLYAFLMQIKPTSKMKNK